MEEIKVLHKKRLIPKLRFKDFNKEFENKEFDEITDITRLAGYEYSEYWKEDDKKEIIALRGYNVGKGKLELHDIAYISNELSMQLKRSRLYKGDIVYPCVGSIGNAVVIEENDKFHIQQNIAKITCKEGYSPYYLMHFLTSNYGMNEVNKFNASGAQPNVLVGSLRKFKINIPTLPEQQKIASFLSAVDEKIQLLNRKKQLLEQYKKGVMQQLFSGKLRFKDENGKQYTKWEEKKLGDVLDYIQPTKYLVESTEYDDSYETPVLTAGKTFILGYTNETKNIFKENLPVILFDDFTTATQFVDFPFKAKSSAMKILVPKENENIKFIYAAMQLIKFEVGGHGRHWISQYALMNISYPCIEEQKKIADFLSAIDIKIESLSNQINQTQNFKKGLLQQMFV